MKKRKRRPEKTVEFGLSLEHIPKEDRQKLVELLKRQKKKPLRGESAARHLGLGWPSCTAEQAAVILKIVAGAEKDTQAPLRQRDHKPQMEGGGLRRRRQDERADASIEAVRAWAGQPIPDYFRQMDVKNATTEHLRTFREHLQPCVLGGNETARDVPPFRVEGVGSGPGFFIFDKLRSMGSAPTARAYLTDDHRIFVVPIRNDFPREPITWLLQFERRHRLVLKNNKDLVAFYRSVLTLKEDLKNEGWPTTLREALKQEWGDDIVLEGEKKEGGAKGEEQTSSAVKEVSKPGAPRWKKGGDTVEARRKKDYDEWDYEVQQFKDYREDHPRKEREGETLSAYIEKFIRTWLIKKRGRKYSKKKRPKLADRLRHVP